MQAFEIEDRKKFTGLLFTGDFLNNLLVHEIHIKTGVDVTISGRINAEFFDDQKGEMKNTEHFTTLGELKPICYQLIKGKRLPLMFSMILSLDTVRKENWLKAQGNRDISNLFINIKYENKKLTLISACAYTSFSLDKDTEKKWDFDVERLLKTKQIEYVT